MMRQIVMPAAVLLACLVGVFGFFLWDEFHAQWGPNLVLEDADAGNLTAQRRLASCYAKGCPPNFAPEPVLACAWREIITQETNRASRQDLSAQHKACSQISVTDRDVLSSAEDDIRFIVSRGQKPKLTPKQANAGTRAPSPGSRPVWPRTQK